MENHEIAIAPEQPQAAPQNKIFKCTLCSYTTTNRQKYRSHYRTHPMHYHCFCGFSTDRKFSLQRHLRKKRCEEIYGKRFDFEQIPSRKRRAKGMFSCLIGHILPKCVCFILHSMFLYFTKNHYRICTTTKLYSI